MHCTVMAMQQNIFACYFDEAMFFVTFALRQKR